MPKETADASPPAAPPGRPRDYSRDTAIASAALELVTEVGYERLSIEAVAARAGTSKATVYRRWPNKGALVAAAVRNRDGAEVEPIDEGSLRGDLIKVVTVMSGHIGAYDMGLLTGIFAGMRNDPQLADALREGLLADKVGLTTQVFERAVGRGEPLRHDANLLFHQTAPAVVIYRLVVQGQSTDEVFLTHLVDEILLPVLTHLPPCSLPTTNSPRKGSS